MQDSKSVWRLNSSLRPSARALEKMDSPLARNDGLNVRT